MRQIVGIGSSLVVALSPVMQSAAYAQGISGGGGHAPEVLTSGNGTPLVMIQTPNAAGVSHNTYDTFDVDSRGAILNNIDSNYGRTQLGGYVQGNGNLRDGTARIIINEVVANNPSEITGYLEVGGARADVVIANPYGITCDGCGFINTDHAMLTTGSPKLGPDGRLTSIDVSRGHVAIGERGLDATGVSQFDLLSRTVSFAGAIYGQNVRVVAGRNNIIYATGEIEVKGDDGGEALAIAIDSTVLGGMYADRITIRATERGAGVRAPETMAANAGEMHITADGRLVMGQASGRKVTLRSQSSDVEIRKQVYAAEQAGISAARNLMIATNAQLVAESTLAIDAGGDVRIGRDAVAGSRQADISARIGDSLELGRDAQLVSQTGMAIGAVGLNMAREAVVSAGGDITTTLSGQATMGESAVLASGQDIRLMGGDYRLGESAIVAAGGMGELSVGRLVLNGGVVQTGQDLTLDAGRLEIESGTVQAGGGLGLSLERLTGSGHVLSAADGLMLEAGLVDLGDGEIVAGGNLSLRGDRLVIGGVVASREGMLDITAGSGGLAATGTLAATGDIHIASAGMTDLGHVQAGGQLSITSASDITGHDSLESGAMMDIATRGSLRGLALHAGIDVIVRASGDILIGDEPGFAGMPLPHDAATDPGEAATGEGGAGETGDNGAGNSDGEEAETGEEPAAPVLSGSDYPDPDTDVIVSPGLRIGDVWAGQDIDLEAGGRIVVGNSLVAGHDIRLSAGNLIDVGLLQLGGVLDLVSASGESRIGQLLVTGDFILDTAGHLTLGAIASPGSLTIRADSLAFGSVAAGTDLMLGAVTGDILVDGDVLAGGLIALDAGGSVSAGRIVAEGAVDIAAGADLAAEAVQSAERLTIRTGGGLQIADLINAHSGVTLIAGGQLSAGAVQALNGIVTIDAGGDAGFAGAVIAGGNAIVASGGDLVLSGIQSGGGLQLTAAQNLLFEGDVLAAGPVGINVGGQLVFTAAATAENGISLLGENGVTIDAGALLLGAYGQIANLSGGMVLAIEGATRIGTGASLLSTDALQVASTSLHMAQDSTIQTRTLDLILSGAVALDARAQITANALDLRAQELSLAEGSLIAQHGTGQMLIGLAGGLNSTGGTIQSAGTLDLAAGSVDMASIGGDARALLIAEGALNLATARLTADLASLIQSNSADLTLRGQSGVLAVEGGTLRAAGEIDLRAGRVSVMGSDIGTGSALSIRSQTDTLIFGGYANAAAITLNAATDADISGELLSGGDITLAAGGNLTHASAVTTPGLLRLTAGGFLSDHGRGILPEGADANAAALGSLQMSGAEITTAGSYRVAGDVALTATQGRLRHDGSLVAGGVLRALAAAAMINAGTLQAASLDLQAASLDNQALLAAAGDLGIALQGDLGNGGTILAGANLTLDLGSNAINRAGGEIATHDGITRISAMNLINNGTLGLADARLDLTGDLRNSGILSANTSGDIVGALVNSGTIQGGDHNLGLGSFSNQGSFVTDGSIALTFSGGLLRNAGTLHADGRISATGANDIRNLAGAELSAAQLLLSADNITNAGDLLAASWASIEATEVLQNSGLIQSAAAHDANGGVIASGLSADRIVNSGDIVTDQGALVITARTSLTNSGQISGNGTESHIAIHSDSLPDLGAIAAEGVLELANATGGLLDTLVTRDGDEIVTEGSLIIRAARIENGGAIAGLSGLTLIGNNLINTGVLYSDADITLQFRNLVENDGSLGGGLILAAGNLAVTGRTTAADGTALALSRLTNHHGGIIQTLNGDMAFHVGTFENLRAFTSTTTETFNDFPEAISNNDGQWSFCAEPGVDCSNTRNQANGWPIANDQLRIRSERVDVEFQDALPAQVLSGGNILFQGGSLLNQYSLISAVGDIGFDLDSVTNTGTETGERVRFLFSYDASSASDQWHFAQIFGFTGSEADDFTDLSLYRPEGGVLGAITEPDRGLVYGESTSVRVYFKANEVVLDHPGYGILDLRKHSGFVSETSEDAHTGIDDIGYVDGRFAFSRSDWADFVSNWSFIDPGYAFGTIQAGGTITGHVSGFVTNGAVAGGQIHRPGDTDADFAILAATGAHSAASGGALIGGGTVVTASMLTFTPEGDNLDQAEVESRGVASKVAGIRSLAGFGLTGSGGSAGIETGRPDAPPAVAVPGRADVDLGAIGRDNLFVVNQDPGSDYLVESRYDFIDRDRFISSDYFLASLGYEPDTTQRRLGDGMVETWLIRDQIFSLTGRNLLTGQGSEYDQLRAMYDNAADQAAGLGLTPGVALTPAQVAALTSDIVWLEERIVSGQRVLVPQVYLTEATIRENARAGAQIIGDAGISLSTGGLINSGGAIGSTRGATVIASAGDIVNDYGLIFGGANAAGAASGNLPSVVLSAGGSYSSTSGLVKGEDVVIAATDILIRTDVTRVQSGAGYADIAGPVAGIQARGDIVLDALRDIGIAGADLAAGSNVRLLAGGNLTLGTITLEAELGHQEGSNYDYLRSSSQRVTAIDAGGNIALISTGTMPGADGLAHITLAGSDLTAGSNIAISAAAGDVRLLAVADEFYSDRARKSSSMLGLKKKSSRDQIYDLSQNTVALSGQEIDIYAKGDVIAEGTGFVADGRAGQDAIESGDLRITSETGNIDFLAVESLHAEKHERSSKFLGGLISKSKTTEDVLSDMEGVTVTTTGNLDLSAARGSVLLQGGSYAIGGDLVLTTDQVYLQGIIDSSYRFEHENDNNGFTVTDETRVTVVETADMVRITTGGANGLLGPDGPAVHIGGRGDDRTTNDQFTRGGIIEALGPQGILPYAAGATGDDNGDADGGKDHWTTALADEYEGAAGFRTVSLSDITGPGSDYLAALAADGSGRVTWGEETQLLELDHYEKIVSAGVLTKAIIAIATHGMGAWATFAVNTVVDGIISGELDLGNILKDAVFTAIMNGVDIAGIDGIHDSALLSNLPDTGLFGTNILSQQWLAAGIVDGAVQTGLYGGDLAGNIADNLQSRAIDAALARSQNWVGDVKGGEGSLNGMLLHGLAGCAAAAAHDGDCAAGLIAAAASEFATGVYDRHYSGNQDLTAYTVARYVNPILAALASGGDVSQFNANLAIQNSQLKNNYLTHKQREQAERLIEDLARCNTPGASCSDEERMSKLTELQMLRDLSNAQTLELIAICSQGPSESCQSHLDDAAEFEDWALYSAYNDTFGMAGGYTPSMLQAMTSGDYGVENQLPLDQIALKHMRAIQNGEVTPDEAAIALDRELQTYDGRYKAIGGLAEIVAAGACLGTRITCVLGLMTATIGADRLYEGTVTAITGEDQLSAIEAAAKAAGVKDPEGLRDDIEAGVAIVTIGAGGTLLVYKGGQFVANLGRSADQVLPKTAVDDLVAPNAGPRLTIRDHYNHHRDMTNDLKAQLEAQGYRVSDREISFGSSCGTGRCRPDIVYEMPDGRLGIIEVKTGNADLTIRQSEIYPQINSGDAIPRGQVAADFGLTPGVPLRDQGYPNGISIEIRNFPGAQ
ncbi:filamentous hemagglutinin N-terminal domain-containing protein [Paracoccus sp. (in: a-proteobacteria)]|uniref:two-partner secretion domain-containing protein n=1 Tax=Paracoccus sp. TaxID=267 RepID=UPI0028AF715F|nr:filamentous hemagglutinin N-terminal domain-containing protein [Paracoccus sp. (in: a-proteobacteria)]